MQIETLVLYGYERLSQIIRQLVDGFNAKTVGVAADILVDFIARAVIDHGGLTGCYHIIEADDGGGGQDSLEGAQACGCAADTDADECGQRKLDQSQQQLSFYFCCLGVQRLLFCAYSLFSVIHEVHLSLYIQLFS